MTDVPQDPNEPQIDLGEILAAMDELGRAKFNEALERVKNAKLMARITELESQRAADRDAMRGEHPPPNGAVPRALAERKKLVEAQRQAGGMHG